MTFEEMKNLPEEEQEKLFSRLNQARAAGKTCLPVDNTEVLTSTGWKMGKDVCVGEYVLSLNNETERMEFCEVVDTVFFQGSEVVSLANHNWELESTEDHRWVVNRRKDNGKKRVTVREYRTTKNLNTECNIVTSAPYLGGNNGVTVDEARVVSWVLSDGYLGASKLTGTTSQGKDGRRQGVKMSIAQSKEKYFDEVKNDLDSCGLEYGVSVNNSGVEVFTISSPSAREFLGRVGLPLKSKHDIDYTKWILGLSYEALEGFLDAFWKADGWTSVSSRYNASKIISQNKGRIEEAVHLVMYLLGRTVLNNTSRGFGEIRMQDRNSITMQKAKEVGRRVVDVFCLTTKNSNFVIRQNNFITITGNCNYAAVYGSGAKTLAAGSGVTVKEAEDLLKGYWDVNWSVKAIADEQVVITDKLGLQWLVNPINGFCYSVRSEKDYFSTLAQGTGSFFFDMWVNRTLEKQKERWGKCTLTASIHDEKVFVFKDLPEIRDTFETMIRESIKEVSEEFMVRRELDCDVQFGKRYSEIH